MNDFLTGDELEGLAEDHAVRPIPPCPVCGAQRRWEVSTAIGDGYSCSSAEADVSRFRWSDPRWAGAADHWNRSIAYADKSTARNTKVLRLIEEVRHLRRCTA